MNIVAIGLTPCDGYAGDGATGTGTNANDPCTATVDANRKTVNGWLSGNTFSWTAPTFYYLDPDKALGVPDTTNNEIKLNPNAAVADHVNLTAAGYAALNNAVIQTQDAWALNDGTGNTAADSAPNVPNAYIPTDPYSTVGPGKNTVSLNNTYTWTSDPTRGNVVKFDGTTGYGNTSSASSLNTANSFSVSAWVNLTSAPTRNATIAAQDGTQASGFYLQYNKSNTSWCLQFMNSDIANATGNAASPCTTLNTAPATWVHLVGTYNATTKTAQLYVNGNLAATGTGITTWAANGNSTIGAALYNNTRTDYFPGMISNVQTWSYALIAPQVTALYQQINH